MATTECRFTFGDKVLDRISRIEGTIDKIAISAHAEPEYRIVRDGVDSDGRPWPELWLYESRLV
jgi:hypothetical protein